MELDKNAYFENDLKKFIPIAISAFLEEIAKDKEKIEELSNLLLTQHEKIKLKEKENKWALHTSIMI